MTAVDPITFEPTPVANPEARSRRQVLCGLMVALVAPGALVAACSDTGTGGSGGTSGGGGSTTTGGGAPGGGSTTGPLAALNDVPVGSGLLVDNPGGGGKILLVRPAADTVRAFDPACPHQGTQVDLPKNGTIACPNHGSTFDGGTGALKGGPAKTGLTEIPVTVDGDQVILA
ncbi:Rieske (2Fe-2S) protein [Actinokineospora sp.]|uniref:Rieske (2Fe-2S) protein n=1 Tax=Actinokineospora sp. TaxID=1872133 RepID=UPI004037DC83